MKTDIKTSTVTFAGRRFPAVNIICPALMIQVTDPGTDAERMLGGPWWSRHCQRARSYQVLIPCENGVLVGIEQYEDQMGYTVTLHARSCQT